MTKEEAQKYLYEHLDLDGKCLTTPVKTATRKILSLNIEEGSPGLFHVACELETETGRRYFDDLKLVLSQYNII